MKWKPATDSEVEKVRQECSEWAESDSLDSPPDMPTWRVMSLVLKIEQLQRKLKAKTKGVSVK